MTLLLTPKPKTAEPPKLRNRTGIKNLIYRAIPKGQRVTLDDPQRLSVMIKATDLAGASAVDVQSLP